MLQNWISEIIYSWLSELAEAAGELIETAFFIESMPGFTNGVLTEESINRAVTSIYFILLGLLALKLCWKGYKIHVLELDGDAEIPPTNLLKNAIYALATAIAFPIFYKVAAELAIIISDKLFDPFSSYELNNVFFSVQLIFVAAAPAGWTMIFSILVIMYVIVAVVLWFRMIRQGFELLIFRLGVPIAVIGLVDSDGGLWKSYLQQFFRQLATIMIQSFCIKLSIFIIAGCNIAALAGGISLLLTAFSMPKLLQTMLIPSGGGSGSLHTLSSVALTFAKGG